MQPPPESKSARTTRFVAFYSHKGGVGRSMALCNTAYVLARRGHRVALIDLDLEAPGLHHSDLFVNQFSSDNAVGARSGGLLGLIDRWREWLRMPDTPFDWQFNHQMIRSEAAFEWIKLKDPKREELGVIDLFPAGRFDSGYRSRLAQLDWSKLYSEHAAGAMFEGLKEALRQAGYDYVLIDSRTGLSDAFYVATLTLADTVVLLTSLNHQNILGSRDAVQLMRDPATVEEFGEREIILIASPSPGAFVGPEEVAKRLHAIQQEEWPGFTPALTLPYVPALSLREDTLCRQIEKLGQNPQDDTYARAFHSLVDGLEGATDLLLKPPQESYNERSNPFLTIRSDYQSEDELLRHFVDPGKHLVEATEDFMPAIIEGARGSGKTMLARNYAYETEVERGRLREQCRRIGLYFRLEVDLLRSFDIRDEALRPMFDQLFGQFWDLLILRKALLALSALGGGTLNYWLPDEEARARLFTRLAREMGRRDAEARPISQQVLLDEVIENLLSDIRFYLNNPSPDNVPVRVQSNVPIKLLVETLRRSGRFRDTYFVVLVDEFENLRDYQQRVVNTRLKQSKRDDGITYKLFIRHGGLKTSATEADGQPIQNVHDYRRFVLDEDLEFADFQRHARQIVERHLQHSLFARHGVRTVDDLFASIGPEEEAERIHGKGRRDALTRFVTGHGGLSAGDKQQFLAWLDRQSAILRRVVAVLMVNQGKPCAEVMAEFDGDSPRARDWLHNYQRGGLFWLCALHRVPKLYAGFNDMVGIAGYNIRYLLDQCQVVVAAWLEQADKTRPLPIPVELQSEAILSRSKSYRRVLLEEGEHSRDLQRLIERLGRVFEALHRSSVQSEPEQNHFKLKGEVSERSEKVLRVAYQAAALRRLDENKQKSLADVRGDVWQLHPRFAPMFSISWRRKKQLVLDAADFEHILWGEDSVWARWLALFQQRQRTEPDGDDPQMRMALEPSAGD